MAIHVGLNHKTTYDYDRPVNLGAQVVRLRPAPHSRTRILSYSLRVEPETHFVNWQQDPFGNWLARLVFPEKTTRFSVEVDLVAEMAVYNPFDFFLEEDAETYPFTYDPALHKELAPFLEAEPADMLLAAWLKGVDRSEVRTMDFLVAINQRLQGDIGYVIRMEPGIQSCEQTLGLRTGSCRDSSWLLVQIFRHLGLAARFVSGYLIQLTADIKALDGPSGTEIDFTDLHAWVEVFLPGAGWIGLDPTSGLLAGEGHIPLAATPDPQNAAPITGAVDPCEVTFGHAMSVQRVFEPPRVTKPYTDDQWRAILACGTVVDQSLAAGDVRLTMGGEPTFVSLDHVDEAEWGTAAVGPTKRPLAEELIRRFQARFAPGGMLHFGQGKWYPGEQLPRWAFSLYWRGDGLPLWRNPDLVAGETAKTHATIGDAEQFMVKLTQRLGLDADFVIPAYEDPAIHLLKEQSLPENLQPGDPRLDDPQERARLARVLEHGLGAPVSYVLPLQHWQSKAGSSWLSEHWRLRRGKLVLVPGDSPAGFRLPLGSLPWLSQEDYPHIVPLDPFAAQAALPAVQSMQQDRLGRPPGGTARPMPFSDGFMPATGSVGTMAGGPVTAGLDEGPQPVRTALAIEPRDGILRIFLPPLKGGEDFVDLVEAIEDTARELGQPVHMEGYTPAGDARLNVIRVTPDPGVIEVNIHPAHGWTDAVAITEAIYEEARLTRLGTEKFMVDGRHIGTGGGNHIVMGGAKPEDSPFLRRPDMLGSLVTYWQNHPALSFLFSGLFIGPTSQAPRIDEARNDQLYELEIALKEVPEPGTPCPPWLVDRIFRNLLVDVSGNTHRAEICIDKLFSPDGPTGRLGLVEFRAFEMPPHERMSLAQQLLLRALVAWFWDKPYKAPLVRWGTSLHDRFMLPHFVWRDFCDVIRDLQGAGFAMQPEWFQPHFEFKFPLYGEIEYHDLRLELRQALEPWHVMGEEGSPGGTVRFVDSSVERLQVRVSGITPGRHLVTCNGHATPLAPTGTRGEAVAGVRYRAWQPASCLHPTIGVHSPLTFDIYDSWNGRSLGGCTYHVVHPGGLSYETFPINSYEAESRRLARFERAGHTPGPMQVAPSAPNPDFPHTLDLRRF